MSVYNSLSNMMLEISKIGKSVYVSFESNYDYKNSSDLQSYLRFYSNLFYEQSKYIYAQF